MGLLQKFLDPWGIASTTYHAVTGTPTADEKRNAARAVSEQVDAYKKQTELSQEMIAEKKDQEQVEKRRLDDKFVSSIRNRRSGGFLGSGDTAGFPDTLGG